MKVRGISQKPGSEEKSNRLYKVNFFEKLPTPLYLPDKRQNIFLLAQLRSSKRRIKTMSWRTSCETDVGHIHGGETTKMDMGQVKNEVGRRVDAFVAYKANYFFWKITSSQIIKRQNIFSVPQWRLAMTLNNGNELTDRRGFKWDQKTLGSTHSVQGAFVENHQRHLSAD